MLTGLIVFVGLTGIMTNAQESEVTRLMKHLQVIPDVINVGPTEFLKVEFESGVMVNKGRELSPTQVQHEPQVEWRAERDSFYTLVLTDPDAPSRADPSFREWHHWLVVNIPGNNVSKGEVLTQYVGSAPPLGTGLHRYTYLVYKQPKKLTFSEPRLGNRSAVGRANFSIRNFAKKHCLGVPIAGNVYQARWDNIVPRIHEQLGVKL